MSAFVVDPKTITTILTAAIKLNAYPPRRSGLGNDRFNHQNATALGRVLLAENIRSVEHRYPNAPQSERDAYAASLAAYTYLPTLKPVDYVAAAAELASLDYQSCETSDYDTTQAHAIIHAIGFALVRHFGRTP